MARTGKSRLPLSLRRPRTILVIALVLIVGLGWIGRNVEGKLNPTSLDVPGTDANHANKMLRAVLRRLGAVRDPAPGPAEADRTSRARRWSTPCGRATRR